MNSISLIAYCKILQRSKKGAKMQHARSTLINICLTLTVLKHWASMF